MKQQSVWRTLAQKKSPAPLLLGEMVYLTEFHPGSQQKAPSCRSCDATFPHWHWPNHAELPLS